MLMIIGSKVLEEQENKPINLWPGYNLMTLNKMIINVYIKWAIDLKYGKSRLDKNIGFRFTKNEACQVNKIYFD